MNPNTWQILFSDVILSGIGRRLDSFLMGRPVTEADLPVQIDLDWQPAQQGLRHVYQQYSSAIEGWQELWNCLEVSRAAAISYDDVYDLYCANRAELSIVRIGNYQ
eukprot:scaffold613826_cov43-Prasinocladus_malaysianus.AAC.1